MSWRLLFCPHCHQEVKLPLLQFASLKPGWLFCPECGKEVRIPLAVCLVALAAGLLVAVVALTAFDRHGFFGTYSELMAIALKVVGFVVSVGLMMLAWAVVARATLGRFDK